MSFLSFQLIRDQGGKNFFAAATASLTLSADAFWKYPSMILLSNGDVFANSACFPLPASSSPM